jgi:tetratricopeptide (TPR) repeat protein
LLQVYKAAFCLSFYFYVAPVLKYASGMSSAGAAAAVLLLAGVRIRTRVAKERCVERDKFVRKAKAHNKLGRIFYAKRVFENARGQYEAAIKLDPSYASAHYNLGMCLDDLGKTSLAVEHMEAAARLKPSFVEAHSYLAFVLMKLDSSKGEAGAPQLERSMKHCQIAIKLRPDFSEAHYNLATVMRRLGHQDEAVRHTWRMFEEAKVGLSSRMRIKCRAAPFTGAAMTSQSRWSVVCVKWGTKYGAEYVNKLARGVRANIVDPQIRDALDFYCFTDDATGIETLEDAAGEGMDGEGVEAAVIVRPLKAGWRDWWNKALLFSPDVGLRGRVMYIDLDTVITGPLDLALAGYKGTFATMSTDGMLNEQRSDGYNSSVMLWDADEGSCNLIYEVLAEHYQHIRKFIYKFDHWLELLVQGADILQEAFPGQFVEFKQYEESSVAQQQQARLVTFPLHPKPHESDSQWVKEWWV